MKALNTDGSPKKGKRMVMPTSYVGGVESNERQNGTAERTITVVAELETPEDLRESYNEEIKAIMPGRAGNVVRRVFGLPSENDLKLEVARKYISSASAAINHQYEKIYKSVSPEGIVPRELLEEVKKEIEGYKEFRQELMVEAAHLEGRETHPLP